MQEFYMKPRLNTRFLRSTRVYSQTTFGSVQSFWRAYGRQHTDRQTDRRGDHATQICNSRLGLVLVNADVGLLSDYDEWADWCEQTRQRNCTRGGGDLQRCQGHEDESESGLCQFTDVGECGVVETA